jgi:hypothetical protein
MTIAAAAVSAAAVFAETFAAWWLVEKANT